MNRWRVLIAAAIMAVIGAPVLADAPLVSPRPAPRPQAAPVEAQAVDALIESVAAAAAAPSPDAPIAQIPATPGLLPIEVELAVARAEEQAQTGARAPAPASDSPPAMALNVQPVAVLSPGPAEIRPVARPTAQDLARAALRAQRPRARPEQVMRAALPPGDSPSVSPRPERRPANFHRVAAASAAAAARATEPRALSRGGSVCGVREIRGEALAPITSRVAGCGVAAPVRVREVAGIGLTMPATIDCTTAKALNRWVKEGVIPAVGRRGGGLAQIKVIAHYSCRTRNNKPGAKISEHGKGHAVDIAGVILKNGVAITVLEAWRGRNSAVVKAMHRSACGIFGTVLGPDGDRYHQDHLHLDTARYRGGAYCR